MANSLTPRKSLGRPRPSVVNPAKSSPNLGALYALQASAGNGNSQKLKTPGRKSSLSAITLASLPDSSRGYSLGVLGDSPGIGSMPPYTPARGGGIDDLEIGELVDVPGNMHGTVKFIGNVQGKKGIFAGVELSQEFAAKGKNNGDVDG